MFSVVQCVNGNNSVVAEGMAESAAKIRFWQLCATLENAPDVITGQCAILNEALNVHNGYTEEFIHPAPEEPTE